MERELKIEKRLTELENKFGVAKNKIREIELNLIEELVAMKALTICSTGTGGCDASRCKDDQDCIEGQYTCVCVNK